MLRHEGSKPWVCKLCKMAFVQRGEQHQSFSWFHKGATMFFFAGNMLTHIKRVHSGFELEDEDVHKCPHCTCAFRKIGSLRSHLSRFHNDEENEENQGENQEE